MEEKKCPLDQFVLLLLMLRAIATNGAPRCVAHSVARHRKLNKYEQQQMAEAIVRRVCGMAEVQEELIRIEDQQKEVIQQIHENILKCKDLLGIIRLRAVSQYYNNHDEFPHPAVHARTPAPAPEYSCCPAELEPPRTRYDITIGNTSKRARGGSSFKWLCYINLDEVLREKVEKVQFFLHPSYKPHDVVEIRKPPFQILRRGGEGFHIIRVLIFLKNGLDSTPIQIFHKLGGALACQEIVAKETKIQIEWREGGEPCQILKSESFIRPGSALDSMEIGAEVLTKLISKAPDLNLLGDLSPWKRSAAEWWNAKLIKQALLDYYPHHKTSTKQIILLLRQIRQ